MEITSRQKDFLKALIDLYQQKNSSIHYSEISQKLGVSKWTAYDILQLLCKDGFINKEYIIPESDCYKRSKSGRSTIAFYPTKKAYTIFTFPKKTFPAKNDDLNNMKKEMAQKFNELKGKLNVKDLFKEALQTKSPFVFCACVLFVLILMVKKITEGVVEIHLLNQIIPFNTNLYAGVALTFFVGMCIGIIAKYSKKVQISGNNNLDEYIDYIQIYNQYVSQMDKKEQKSLFIFLKGSLNEIYKKNDT